MQNKYVNEHNNCDLCTDKINCIDNHVVYQIKCKKCDDRYVGMTNNGWNIRGRQHQRAVRLKDETNALGQHVKLKHENEIISFNDFDKEVLYRNNNNKLTAIQESKIIKETKPEMNRRFECVDKGYV